MEDLYPTPISPRVLTRGEMYGLVLPLWPYREVDNAVDVFWLESGFNTGAHNQDGEDSRGLAQVNVGPGASPDLVRFNLWDAQLNLWLAYTYFWVPRGWHPWYNSALALGLIPKEGA